MCSIESTPSKYKRPTPISLSISYGELALLSAYNKERKEMRTSNRLTRQDPMRNMRMSDRVSEALKSNMNIQDAMDYVRMKESMGDMNEGAPKSK